MSDICPKCEVELEEKYNKEMKIRWLQCPKCGYTKYLRKR